MQIIANFVDAGPAGFQAAVNYAIQQFDNLFTNNVTLHINVGYGELPNVDGTRGTGPAPNFGQSLYNVGNPTYSALTAALQGQNAPGASTLPPNSPISGTLTVSVAEEKALGLVPDDLKVDGSIGFSSTQPWDFTTSGPPASGTYYIVGAIEHEISEVMGRESHLDVTTTAEYAPLDLYRYAPNSNTRQLSPDQAASFSVDGGTTDLDPFNYHGAPNTGSTDDVGDWAPGAGNDAFLNQSPPGVINGITAADVIEMRALGWTAADTAPVVTPKNATLSATSGQTFAASDLFTASDADGDAITQFDIKDTGGGQWLLNGNPEPANTDNYVSLQDWNQNTKYRAGSATDTLQVRAYDGKQWGPFAQVTVGPPAETAPTVTPVASTITAAHLQSFAPSSLFSASDADGDDVVAYELVDTGAPGAHWVVNGIVQPSGTVIDVTKAQLAQTSYQSGAGSDTLVVRASDGKAFGPWSNPFTVAAPADNAPVVTPASPAPSAGRHDQTFAISSLFTVTDPDSDTITQYTLYDDGAGGGYWDVNGAAQPAMTFLPISPAQYAKTVYHSGPGTDTLLMAASDGMVYSSFARLSVTGKPDQPPSVTVVPNTLLAANGQTFAVSSLITATDPDSDPIQYQIYDPGTGGGHLVLNGSVLPTGQLFPLTPAQFAQTKYVGGTGTDTIYVRASDGPMTSGFQTITFNNPPPVVTVTSASFTVAHHGDAYAATSLFTASDDDQEKITQYQLIGNGGLYGGPGGPDYDNRAGTYSHWVVGGVDYKPDFSSGNSSVTITAQQLAQTVWDTGPNTDNLYVRAWDGSAWSDWAHILIHGAYDTEAHVTWKSNPVTASIGQTFAATSLFITQSDPDGDKITQYALSNNPFWVNAPQPDPHPENDIAPGHWVVDGVPQKRLSNIFITPTQLKTTYYQASASPGQTSDTLYMVANDGAGWGDHWPAGGPAALGAIGGIVIEEPTDTGPVVTPLGTPVYTGDPVLKAASIKADYYGESFAATSLFSFSDPNGYKITEYTLWPTYFTPATQFAPAKGGYWVVGGKAQPTDKYTTVSSLSGVYFVADVPSDPPGTPNPDYTPAEITASDGVVTSYVAAMVDIMGATAPVVTPVSSKISATRHDEIFAPSSLFSATDSRGAAPASYQLLDTGDGGGHWVVSGQARPTGQAIPITAGQLGQTYYQSGSAAGTDTLAVRAADGSGGFGNWAAFSVVAKPDQAPLLPAAGAGAGTGQTFALSNLISATDPDNDPIVQYQVYDKGASGAYLFVNGSLQPAGQLLTLSAAQYAATRYQAGASDTLLIRASDGILWSSVQMLTFTNQPPTVTPASAHFVAGRHDQSFAASSLFTGSDRDDSITNYQLFDDGAGGGHWVVGSQAASSGQIISSGQLGATYYQTVAGSGTDTLAVRAYDGAQWGAFAAFTVTGHPDAPPVVGTYGLSARGQPAYSSWAATDLFTFSDPDNDKITQYRFYNTDGAPYGSPSGGHWEVNGRAEPVGTAFVIQASDLGGTKYVSGVGTDVVYAWASDGELWSNWNGLKVEGDTLPVINHATPLQLHGNYNGVTVAATSLFSAIDYDGDPIRTYDLWDAGGGHGAWVLNGVALPDGKDNYVSTADLYQHTVYRIGTGAEQLYVRAADDIGYGPFNTYPDEPIGVTSYQYTGSAAAAQSSSGSAASASNPALLANYMASFGSAGSGQTSLTSAAQPTPETHPAVAPPAHA